MTKATDLEIELNKLKVQRDYDQKRFTELFDSVNKLHEKLDKFMDTKASKEELLVIESEVKTLKQFFWMFSGAMVIISFLAPYIMNFIVNLITKK